MAIKYLSSLDLRGNELQNAAVHVLSTAPTTFAKIGQIYYNNTNDTLYVCNTEAVGSTAAIWAAIGSEGVATATTLGNIKVYTGIGATANTITTTASRTYGVQLDSSSKAVVNVPWTDTNTVTLAKGTGGTAVSGTVLIQGTGLITTSQSGQNITIATTANNYVHPSDGGGSLSALTGADVISALTVNTAGHVTATSTRTLTLSNLGYSGTSDANTYVHPTNDGNLHVPVTSTTNNGKVLKAGSTAGSIAWSTLTSTDVGLGNVTNTTDANKPVSTATQTALDLKAPLASPTFTGSPSLPTGTTATTQTAGNTSTRVATTAFVSTAVANLVDSAPAALNTLDELAAALGDDANFATTTATSIGLKAPIANPTFTGTVTIPTGASITAPTITGAGAIAGVFTGNITGNVTGNVTGSSGSCTGNAATVTNGVYTTGNQTIAGTKTFSSTIVGSISGSAVTAGRATNIAGGLGGSIPYQTAANTTALLANGSAGQVLQSNGGTAAPTWQKMSYVTSIGNGTATSFDVSHGLATRDLIVQLYDTTTYETIMADVTRPDTSKVTIAFNVAPTTNQVRVLITKI